MRIGALPRMHQEKDAAVAECVESFNRYLSRWPEPRSLDDAVVEWEGEGCFVRDIYGREFLDCLGGFGIFALGHRHPRVVAAVKTQLDRLALHSQWLLNPVAAEAARRLASITPGNLQKTFWCSTGTEAVEGGLKLARLYTGRKKFVSTWNSFHGKTLGSLSVTGRDQFRKPFEPLLETSFVPYGDVAALEHAVDSQTAALILEPVQGEGGVNVPPEDYLPAARRLCTERGALLILDEVQTGFGRTGAMFDCNHSRVVQDVRGRGLLIGLEIANARRGASIAKRLFDRNVLVAHTLNKPEVLRIDPPLIITKALIDRALEAFAESLKEESRM